jgi:hypothetical protein
MSQVAKWAGLSGRMTSDKEQLLKKTLKMTILKKEIKSHI